VARCICSAARKISSGTGLAFAHKYKNDGGVCLTYLGDGAVNQGQVYESFNMAALWKLPVLYIIENNKYGRGTCIDRAAAGELHKRGEPYGIPGRKIDGMDVLKVREAAEEALAYVRGGNGPMLLEMVTYRYRGHSMSDPAKYRTKEEVEEWRGKHDPIDALRELMLKEGLVTEEGLKTIEREIKEIVNDSAEFAQTSPEPDPSELWTDILVET
jgi:pyruvate dehydrogenase E1 component alpha subunit